MNFIRRRKQAHPVGPVLEFGLGCTAMHRYGPVAESIPAYQHDGHEALSGSGKQNLGLVNRGPGAGKQERCWCLGVGVGGFCASQTAISKGLLESANDGVLSVDVSFRGAHHQGRIADFVTEMQHHASCSANKVTRAVPLQYSWALHLSKDTHCFVKAEILQKSESTTPVELILTRQQAIFL